MGEGDKPRLGVELICWRRLTASASAAVLATFSTSVSDGMHTRLHSRTDDAVAVAALSDLAVAKTLAGGSDRAQVSQLDGQHEGVRAFGVRT